MLDAYCQIEAKRRRSINNLREDVKDLLTEMGYNFSVVSTESDSIAKAQFKEASEKLDAARTLAIVNAIDISPREYLARQSKDYLSPDEMMECEKYRLKTFYGKSVTEDLVERDNGGRLYGRLLTFEAVAADSPGEIVNPKTGAKYPAPPLIVTQRDIKERDNLSFCEDTSENQESSSSIPALETWEIFKPYYKRLEDAIDLGISVINQLVMKTSLQIHLAMKLSNHIKFCTPYCLE